MTSEAGWALANTAISTATTAPAAKEAHSTGLRRGLWDARGRASVSAGSSPVSSAFIPSQPRSYGCSDSGLPRLWQVDRPLFTAVNAPVAKAGIPGLAPRAFFGGTSAGAARPK